MKVGFIGVGLFAACMTGALGANKPIQKKLVSLDTVLSCSSDGVIKTVFDTDWITALALNSLVVAERVKDGSADTKILSKGFVTFPLSSDELIIAPTDIRGKPFPETQLSFCNYKIRASYEANKTDGGPHTIEVGGEEWALNPYEVFAHADQFEFTSGVFSNSSRVFLMAKKGRVAIQFICKPTGLVFYRALYYPESGK